MQRFGRFRGEADIGDEARPQIRTAEIPTVDEAGLPSLHLMGWHGLFAPKGTPPAAISTLNSAVIEALIDPDTHKRLADLGQEIFPRDQLTPEALASFQKVEIEKWWPVIKAAGIKVE